MKALININQLVTVGGKVAKRGKQMNDVGIIACGCVVVDGEKIVDVSTTKQMAIKYNSFADMEVVDCTGLTVIPGFVDSHTHLVFGGFRAEEFGMRLKGASYMEIMNAGGGIASSTTATMMASEAELIKSATKRLDDFLNYGVTTVEAKSGYGLDLDTELKQLKVANDIKHSVEVVPTFMGAHAVTKQYKGREDEYIDFIINTVLPRVAQGKLAKFCDVFCEEGVFSVEQSRRLLIEAKKLGLLPKMHADEIVNTCGAELGVEVGCVSADHLLKVSDEGIKALANSDTVATVLPATAFCLREPYANARKLIDSDCIVAVASDLNPGSCYCNNIPLIIALCTMYMKMTIEETITALTLNGAAALGLACKVGSIAVDKQADLVVLDCPNISYLPYNTGANQVKYVFKKGVQVVSR